MPIVEGYPRIEQHPGMMVLGAIETVVGGNFQMAAIQSSKRLATAIKNGELESLVAPSPFMGLISGAPSDKGVQYMTGRAILPWMALPSTDTLQELGLAIKAQPVGRYAVMRKQGLDIYEDLPGLWSGTFEWMAKEGETIEMGVWPYEVYFGEEMGNCLDEKKETEEAENKKMWSVEVRIPLKDTTSRRT
ncbi:hypothetical protein BC829DRAFT_384972, partial [Chytridium lagenaria]